MRINVTPQATSSGKVGYFRSDLRRQLKNLMSERNLMSRDIYAQTDISEKDIQSLMKGSETSNSMTVEKLRILAEVLGCTISLDGGPDYVGEWSEATTEIESLFRLGTRVVLTKKT